MKYKLKFFIWGILFMSALSAHATHIVGGEIQVRYIREYNYDFILNLYFDLINGEPNAKDQSIRVSIFSKSNNAFMDSLRLPIVLEQDVPYSNPVCTDPRLKTRYIRYLRNFTLDAGRYNNAAGYYIIWERCCRNNVISNIVTPGDVGMTFYTEMPQIATGQFRTPYVNSTPIFNIPKGDYLCIGRPFTMDFSATDVDGDELRYSLVTPLAGNSRPDPNDLVIPSPRPGPYAPVIWRIGYSATTAIPHNPSVPTNQLNIGLNTGILRVTPSLAGLYVLSVRCEEYRNGLKIGEVRRDFQFMVLDCPVNNIPSVRLEVGKQPNGQPIFYQEGQTLNITPNNLCFKVHGTDIDNPENLTFRVRPLNFNLRSNFLSPPSGTVRGSTDTLKSNFCWDKCLFSNKDAQGNFIPYTFELIVADDGCPASLSDTIRVNMIYPPTINNEPTMGADAPVDVSGQYNYIMTREVGQLFEFNVFGNDIDNDEISISMFGQGFNPADLGMQFEPKTARGNVSSKFTWTNSCQGVTQQENEFILEFVLKEQGTCGGREKMVRVKLVVIDKDVDLTTFLPANVFSPNGDGYNATFEMPNLPAENCRFKFEKITIFNRWGGKVYESTDRNFKWSGGEFPAATYYYTIDYKGKQYKGTVSLIR